MSTYMRIKVFEYLQLPTYPLVVIIMLHYEKGIAILWQLQSWKQVQLICPFIVSSAWTIRAHPDLVDEAIIEILCQRCWQATVGNDAKRLWERGFACLKCRR